MSTDANGRNHTTAGTPTSGRYAVEVKVEPTLALSPLIPGTPEQRAVIDQLTVTFADALGIGYSAVEVGVDKSQGCGSVAGAVELKLTAKLDDDLHSEVELSARVHEGGAVSDGGVVVGFDIVPFRDEDAAELGFTRDSVGTRWASTEDITPETAATKIAETLDQAHLQRRIEALINRPQRDTNLAGLTGNRGRWDGFYKIVDVAISQGGARPRITVTDRRPASGGRPVDLVLDRATATVVSGRVDTHYGDVSLAGDNLAWVVSRVDRDLGFYLREPGHGAGATKETFERRLAAVFAK